MNGPRTLSSFLLARIAEEENVALDARRWFTGSESGGPTGTPDPRPVTEAFAVFVLAHDADRVLTDCLTRRRIVKLVTGSRWSGTEPDRESLLRLLALPYVGHPGFREGWELPGTIPLD